MKSEQPLHNSTTMGTSTTTPKPKDCTPDSSTTSYNYFFLFILHFLHNKGMKSSIPEISRNSLPKKDLPYIVKDDFITKLKEPRPKKSKTVKTEPITTEVGISSLMVSRKK